MEHQWGDCVDELHGDQPAGALLHLHQPAALRLLQPEHPGGPPPARLQPPGQDPRVLARPPRRLEAEGRIHHQHQAESQHEGK